MPQRTRRGGVFIGPMPNNILMANPSYERLDEIAVQNRRNEDNEVEDDIWDTVNVRDPCTYVTFARRNSTSLLTNSSLRNIAQGDARDPHSRDPLHSTVLHRANAVPIQTYPLPEGSTIHRITFSKTDEYIIGGSKQGRVFVWNTNSGVLLAIANSSPNSKRVVTVWCERPAHAFFVGRIDGTIEKWRISQDGTTYRFISVVTRHVFQNIVANDFSKNQNYVVGHYIQNNEGGVFLAQTMRGTEDTLNAHNSSVVETKISSDGRYIATLGRDNIVSVWNRSTRTKKWAVKGRGVILCSIGFSPDGNTIVIGSTKGYVNVVNVADVSQMFAVQTPTYRRASGRFAFTSNGEFFASGGLHPNIHVWSLSQPALHATVELAPSSYPVYMAFKNTEHSLAVVCNHGFVHLLA
jgi:WD40 repeat protein